MAATDILLVIGFVAIGLSMWFSFKKKENTKPKEIQSDEEEWLKSSHCYYSIIFPIMNKVIKDSFINSHLLELIGRNDWMKKIRKT